MKMVLHRLCYGTCLVIFLYIVFSILLLDYIIHYSFGVQIPLYIHHGLQFEDTVTQKIISVMTFGKNNELQANYSEL
jgi:hypothetical protein